MAYEWNSQLAKES